MAALGAALAGLQGCGGAQTASAPPARHLVVLCIDTLRADRVGAYGHDRPTTPNVDELARTGTRFATAYAHSSWTVPATASLLTARLPSAHGAGLEGDVRLLGADSVVRQIRPGMQKLQSILGSHGFRTALFSANPYLYGNFQEGFDHVEVEWRGAGAVNDSLVRWLAGAGTERVFAYVQYMDLHHPIRPPAPYFHMFPVAGAGARGPEHEQWSFANLRSERDLEGAAFRRFRDHKLALYDGALRYVDDQIGRLRRHLEELGMADETLIVVTSDHGEEFWDHALVQARLGGDPRGFWGVGHGHSLFGELLRVPLVLHGPGAPAREVDCPARHVDVVPTALELLGLPGLAAADGHSLVPALGPGAACPPAPVVAESLAYGPESRSLVWSQRKLIERADGVTMLFDLRRDPEERHDLAAANPGLVERMRALLGRLRTTEQADPSEAMRLDAETERQLRALGYLD